MYADVLRKEVQVISGETGIKGSMLTALTDEERAGILPSLQDEASLSSYRPDPRRAAEFERIFPSFLEHLVDLYPHVA